MRENKLNELSETAILEEINRKFEEAIRRNFPENVLKAMEREEQLNEQKNNRS